MTAPAKTSSGGSLLILAVVAAVIAILIAVHVRPISPKPHTPKPPSYPTTGTRPK